MQAFASPDERVGGYEEGLWARLVRSMVDDGGSDFSGVRAHAALELHMRECAERRAEDRADRQTMHARLNAMQESFDKRMSETTATFDKRMSELTSTLDKRMNSVNARHWAVAGSAILALLGIVAFLIPHYVKGHL